MVKPSVSVRPVHVCMSLGRTQWPVEALLLIKSTAVFILVPFSLKLLLWPSVADKSLRWSRLIDWLICSSLVEEVGLVRDSGTRFYALTYCYRTALQLSHRVGSWSTEVEMEDFWAGALWALKIWLYLIIGLIMIPAMFGMSLGISETYMTILVKTLEVQLLLLLLCMCLVFNICTVDTVDTVYLSVIGPPQCVVSENVSLKFQGIWIILICSECCLWIVPYNLTCLLSLQWATLKMQKAKKEEQTLKASLSNGEKTLCLERWETDRQAFGSNIYIVISFIGKAGCIMLEILHCAAILYFTRFLITRLWKPLANMLQKSFLDVNCFIYAIQSPLFYPQAQISHRLRGFNILELNSVWYGWFSTLENFKGNRLKFLLESCLSPETPWLNSLSGSVTAPGGISHYNWHGYIQSQQNVNEVQNMLVSSVRCNSELWWIKHCSESFLGILNPGFVAPGVGLCPLAR